MSSSPRNEEEEGGPRRLYSLALGLTLARLAGLKGSVNCVDETVDEQKRVESDAR